MYVLPQKKLETKEEFEQWYEKEDPWKIRERKNIVNRIGSIWRIISPHKNKKVLIDCGCGEGVITSFISKQFELSVGIDISRKALLRAKEKVENCDFIVGDIRLLPFGERCADCITCFETLYYLKTDYEKALQEFARVLKSGGWSIVSIQLGKNYFNYDTFMGSFQKYFKKPKIFVLEPKLRFFFERVNVFPNAPILANKIIIASSSDPS